MLSFYDNILSFLFVCQNAAVCIGCSFKFIKAGVEESIVNAPQIQITDHLFKSNLTFALFVFLLCKLTSGTFTIDSSTPTLRRNLNEHPI
jgi:hypothetical protein